MTKIRSFRRVFELERRIYSVDQLRLNPTGVPIRGVAYFGAVAFAALVLARLPLVGLAVRAVPWYLRDIALPAVCAAALAMLRVEGRVFHLAAWGLLRRLAARHACGLTRRAKASAAWAPRPMMILPDGSDARLRRLRYTGPGAVRVAVEHERLVRGLERDGRAVTRRGSRGSVVLRHNGEPRALANARVISLRAGAVLVVRPSRRTRG